MKYFDDFRKLIVEGKDLGADDISKTVDNKDFSAGKKDKMGAGQKDKIKYELTDDNKREITKIEKNQSLVDDKLSIIHSFFITNIDIKSNEVDYFLNFFYKRVKCLGILTINKNDFDNIELTSNLVTLMDLDDEYDTSNINEYRVKGYIKDKIFEEIFPKEAEIYSLKKDFLFFTDDLQKHYAVSGDKFFIIDFDLQNKTIKICPRYIKNKVITINNDDLFKFYEMFTIESELNTDLPDRTVETNQPSNSTDNTGGL